MIHVTYEPRTEIETMLEIAIVCSVGFALLFMFVHAYGHGPGSHEGVDMLALSNLTSFKGAECVNGTGDGYRFTCANGHSEWRAYVPGLDEGVRLVLRTTVSGPGEPPHPACDQVVRIGRELATCTLYRNAAGLTADPELARRLGLEVNG